MKLSSVVPKKPATNYRLGFYYALICKMVKPVTVKIMGYIKVTESFTSSYFQVNVSMIVHQNSVHEMRKIFH